MTPERLAEIKAHIVRVDAMNLSLAERAVQTDVVVLLAEVERLGERLALAEGVIEEMTRQRFELTDRAERLARALEQIASETARGASHDWAPNLAINRIARDVLDG